MYIFASISKKRQVKYTCPAAFNQKSLSKGITESEAKPGRFKIVVVIPEIYPWSPVKRK
jgi:hypothetical protein